MALGAKGEHTASIWDAFEWVIYGKHDRLYSDFTHSAH